MGLVNRRVQSIAKWRDIRRELESLKASHEQQHNSRTRIDGDSQNENSKPSSVADAMLLLRIDGDLPRSTARWRVRFRSLARHGTSL